MLRAIQQAQSHRLGLPLSLHMMPSSTRNLWSPWPVSDSRSRTGQQRMESFMQGFLLNNTALTEYHAGVQLVLPPVGIARLPEQAGLLHGQQHVGQALWHLPQVPRHHRRDGHQLPGMLSHGSMLCCSEQRCSWAVGMHLHLPHLGLWSCTAEEPSTSRQLQQDKQHDHGASRQLKTDKQLGEAATARACGFESGRSAARKDPTGCVSGLPALGHARLLAWLC